VDLEYLVVFEVAEVQFFEEVLHCYEAVGVLLDDVGLGLFDVIAYLPNVERVLVASNQPHLIDL
jgi:hypothetical protein